MKYSMFSWFGYYIPFKDRIKIIADAGFDEAMISWEDEQEPWIVRKEDFPEIVRRRGLGITNVHLPFIGYNDIWEDSRIQIESKLTVFKSYVKDCNDFDIPAMVMHTCDLEDFNPDLDKGKAFFSELADTAENYGVDLAVENVSRQYLLEYLLDEIMTEILSVPTTDTISYEVIASEQWRRKHPCEFATAVLESLTIN